MNTANRQRRPSAPNIVHKISTIGPRIISRAFFIAKLVGVIYLLYLLSIIASEFKNVSSKLNNIEHMARDINRMSSKLSSMDKTNAGIIRMERYMRYIPLMADTGKKALDQSSAMNLKVDQMNLRLIGANASMTGSAGMLMDVSSGLYGINGEIRRMRASVEHMASGLPELSGMQQIMEQTNASLIRASTCMQDVSTGIDDIGGDFGEMRELLKGMSMQFTILPEMKQSLDTTNDRLTAAFTAMEPLSNDIPAFRASLQEINETSRQMNQTTQEMSAGLKKAHKQGIFGLAVLTATGLAH
ncbi:hypothetical protein LLG46_08425 [bacterium]|nr:hypothetical protein [bacterium]